MLLAHFFTFPCRSANRAVALGCVLLVGWNGSSAADPPGKWDALWADLANSDEVARTRAILAFAATPQESVPFLRDKLKPVVADRAKLKKWLADLAAGDAAAQKAATAEIESIIPLVSIELNQALDAAPTGGFRNRLSAILEDKDYWSSAVLPHIPRPVPPPPTVEATPPAIIAPPAVPAPPALPKDGAPPAIGVPAPMPANTQRARAVRVEAITPTCKSWTRTNRALAILEHIGRPDAVAIIRTVAEGEIDATPTHAAQDALIRLGLATPSAEIPKIQAVFAAYRAANAKGDVRAQMACCTPEVIDEMVFQSFFACGLQNNRPKIRAALKSFVTDADGIEAEFAKRYKEKHGVDLVKQQAEYERRIAKAIEDYRKKSGSKDGEVPDAVMQQIEPPPQHDDQPLLKKVLAEKVADKLGFIAAVDEATRQPGDIGPIGELSSIRVRGDAAIGRASRTYFIGFMHNDERLQKARSDSVETFRFRKTKSGWLLETPR